MQEKWVAVLTRRQRTADKDYNHWSTGCQYDTHPIDHGEERDFSGVLPKPISKRLGNGLPEVHGASDAADVRCARRAAASRLVLRIE